MAGGLAMALIGFAVHAATIDGHVVGVSDGDTITVLGAQTGNV